MLRRYLQGTLILSAMLMGVGWFVATGIQASAPALSGGGPADDATAVSTTATVSIASDAALSGNSLAATTWVDGGLTSSTLQDLSFPSTTVGYAVGDAGFLAKSADGGATWAPLTSGTSNNLNSVTFATIDIGWVSGASGTIRKTTDGGVTWTAQTSGTSDVLRGIAASSTSVAWIVGNSGTVLKTTDGGTTWTSQTSGTTVNLYGAFTLNATTVLAAGQTADFTQQAIIRTTDGGTTWTAVTPSFTKDIAAFGGVFFLNATTGWVSGAKRLSGVTIGIVFRTTDGGVTWAESNITGSGTVGDVRFANATTGIAVSESGAFAYQSTDGGVTWNAVTTGALDSLNAVVVQSTTSAILAGDNGTMLRTTDGTSWTAVVLGVPGTGYFAGLQFIDASTGYAVTGGGAQIVKTADGGRTWTVQASGVDGIPTGLHFPVDGTTGWVSQHGGGISRTINSGATWVSQTSGTTQHLFATQFFDTTTGYVVGNNGRVHKTTDGGATWTAKLSSGPNLYALHFPVNATTGWAAGDSGNTSNIRRTTDGGDTWTTQTSPTSAVLYGVYFADTTTGWTVGAGGVIRKTTDAGATWTAQTSGTAQDLRAIRFLDANVGYVVGLAGTILKTTNGGSTWTAQTSGTSVGLYALSIPNTFTLFAGGGNPSNGSVPRTLRRGDTQTTLQPHAGNTRSGTPTGPNTCSSLTLTNTDTTITCSHPALVPGTWYTFTITGGASGIQSSTGDTMSTSVTRKFRTAFASGASTTLSASSLSSLASEGYLTVTGSSTAASDATFGPEIQATVSTSDGTATVTVPQSTVLSRSGGGTFDTTAIALTDASSVLTSVPGTSRAAVQFGIPSVGLTAATAVTLALPVASSVAAGTVLDVYRDTDTDFSNASRLTTCTVASSACTFTTTSLSYFAAAEVGAPKATDAIPPAMPTGLSATAAVSGVTLSWIDPTDPDLATLRIVRYTGSTQGAAILLTQVAPGTETHADHSVTPDTTYVYEVQAVDQSGNRTIPGATVTVTVPAMASPPTDTPTDGGGGSPPTPPAGDDRATPPLVVSVIPPSPEPPIAPGFPTEPLPEDVVSIVRTPPCPLTTVERLRLADAFVRTQRGRTPVTARDLAFLCSLITDPNNPLDPTKAFPEYRNIPEEIVALKNFVNFFRRPPSRDTRNRPIVPLLADRDWWAVKYMAYHLRLAPTSRNAEGERSCVKLFTTRAVDLYKNGVKVTKPAGVPPKDLWDFNFLRACAYSGAPFLTEGSSG